MGSLFVLSGVVVPCALTIPPSTYSPTPADRGISSSEGHSRSVSVVHYRQCAIHLCQPRLWGTTCQLINMSSMSSGQRDYFLDAQYLENRQFSMVGQQGGLLGRQLIVQSQPVVPRVGWGGGEFHPICRHCGNVIRVVDAGQAILPLE